MNVEHFGGTNHCSEMTELEAIFKHRHENDSNEIIIRGNAGYPRLAVLILGDAAVAYFHPYDGHAGFTWIDDEVPYEPRIFYTGSPRNEIEISSQSVISADTALAVAEEFFLDPSRPPSLLSTEL